jgi:hypothetical protein
MVGARVNADDKIETSTVLLWQLAISNLSRVLSSLLALLFNRAHAPVTSGSSETNN